MKNWQEVKLGNVININPESIQKNYPNSVINYIDISSVKSGVIEDYKTIELKKAPSRAKRIVKNKDVILSTVRPANRSFFYFKKCEDNNIVSTGFAVLRAKEQFIDSRFLYNIIRDRSFTNYLVSNEQGAAYPAVTPNIIEKTKILLPPLPTQKKIASILSAYDDKIENNLKQINLLEEKAQITYEEWFVRMKFPGHETTLIDESTGLPQGWERKKLGEVCELVMGQSPKSEFYNKQQNGFPFHQGVSDYGDRFPNNSIWSTSGNRFAFEDDILFSVRAPVGRLNISKEKIILGRGLASIKHKYTYNGFLYYQLKNLFYKEDVIGGGAIFNSVTRKDMEDIKLLQPDSNVLEAFSKMVVPIDRVIKNLTKQNTLLKEARDILLPRLMTGMIDVGD